MRYLGGKSKIAKDIAAVIVGRENERAVLIEPFVGGGASTASLAPFFEACRSYDIDHDLIMMWDSLQRGWIPPLSVTEEEYEAFRAASHPSPIRGFISHGASWGGKKFGGYARGGGRNYAEETARNLSKIIKNTGNVSFGCCDYRNITVRSGDVVYCDPPYAGTTDYKTSFDSREFWGVAKRWADGGAQVYVSEYNAPEPWLKVWEKTRTRDMRADMVSAVKVTERLYFMGYDQAADSFGSYQDAMSAMRERHVAGEDVSSLPFFTKSL